jgi:hypothetical protein
MLAAGKLYYDILLHRLLPLLFIVLGTWGGPGRRIATPQRPERRNPAATRHAS